MLPPSVDFSRVLRLSRWFYWKEFKRYLLNDLSASLQLQEWSQEVAILGQASGSRSTSIDARDMTVANVMGINSLVSSSPCRRPAAVP